MQATLGELATLVGGQITGDDQLVIRGAATLHDAGPGQITGYRIAGRRPS
jgi:UDP-3-O-[3-hydroxymyristoyl] glucosamine N-acyltransferase